MTDNVEALSEGEENRQSHQAEELEIDPYGFAEIEGDRKIQDAKKNEKEYPGKVEPFPLFGFQGDVAAHHSFRQRLATEKGNNKETCRK